MPTVHFLAASSANYTVAHRPGSAIRLIVIHVTESSAASAETWFRNPKAQASANYVVGQDGSITQMVRDSDIAWHAGNWSVNRESIGIEHGGYTYRKGTFTDAEYRASAQLVASEMRHYILPIDRKHIIGHSQVPDPNHAGLFGGFAHHTDPGPYWNWTQYLNYVKTYARGGAPAPKVVNAPAAAPAQTKKPSITATVGKSNKVEVASSGLKDGQTVSGFVNWAANVSATDVQRVEFLVDGRVRTTGKSYNWDTTKETNGAHVLTLRVVTKKNATAGQSLRVTVANSPFTIASANLTNGATLSKTARWEAVPSGAAADHVDFLLDDKLINTEKDAPYLYNGDGNWDTTKVANGPHTLTLRAVSVDGRIAESSIGVVVQNATSAPKPRPVGASISMNNLWDGAVVSGRVNWTATTAGATPKRVEFWVDGRWRWSENSAPWVFGGDGNTWDTTQEKTGRHQVTVKAVMPNGAVSDFQTVTITIQSPLTQDAAPAATSMAVASSIADGATVHGGVPWTATVKGTTPDRVDFYIDGKLEHTERSAPYEFGTWDTTQATNGAHTLVVRATAPDGTASDVTQTVQVSNAAPTVTIVSQTVADASTVNGSVAWAVTTSGLRPDRVDFYVDGKLVKSDSGAPYSYSWDTTAETNGTHTLLSRAIAGTQVDQRSVTVAVANSVALTSSLRNGQTVSGTVTWTVSASTGLSIDGTVRATGTSYTWDTTKETDGSHTLRAGTLSFTVTVRNAALAFTSSTLASGATVSGSVTWTVGVSPTPDKVDFYVDGTLQHTETSAPYDFAWDTTKVADGSHTLLAKTGSATNTITVTVKNAPTAAAAFSFTSSTLSSGATVSGAVTWTVGVSPTPDTVDFYVDGTLQHTERSAPYDFAWDTTRVADGSHTLLARTGTATKTVTVTVENSSTGPAPTPSPTPTLSSSLADGATVSGSLGWTATTNASRVDFYVDGTLRKSDGGAPFSFTWDTTAEKNGAHTLMLETDATSVTLTVTVQNAALGVTQSLTDGATLSGTVSWLATPAGPAKRVEFLVDGNRVATFRRSPWGGDLDTTKLSNGTYTLAVRAVAADGTTATSSITVTVHN